MIESADARTADTLHSTLATLEANGVDRFDPVRFCYIQSMAKRSQQQHGKVAKLLVEKTWQALQAYQSGFSEERTEVKTLLDAVCAQRPALTEQMQKLLEACDFNAIRRMAQQQEIAEDTYTFATLTQRLQAGANDTNELPTSDAQELKSLRLFRDALQQQHAEKLVSHALMDAPQSAGPLNPQKLALRSLAIMRDVSPAYLGHFVSYVDTLFWLEKLDPLTPSK